MKTKLVFMMTILVSHFAISQEIFLKAGRNFTTYNYKNSLSNNLAGLQGSMGSNFEFGVEFFLDGADSKTGSRFSYSASLSLNQFNAKGGDVNNTYVWNTNYLGIQNMVYGSALKSSDDYYSLKLKAGFNTSTIVSGQQYINNVVYDLKNNMEFKGVLIQPIVGMDLRLNVGRELGINFGYSFSKAFNVSNKSSEKLGFTNNQVQLGLQYTIH